MNAICTLFRKIWFKLRDLDTWIYLLAILSIWLILHVKLEIVPLVPMSNMTNSFAIGLNEIASNLSYSYLAGLIMYVLTVTIPEYRRRRIYKTLVDHLINSYYERVLYSFFAFYSTKTNVIDIDMDESIVYYKTKQNAVSWNLLTKIVQAPDPELDKWRLTTLLDASNDFVGVITFYEKILSNDQLVILNQIRKNGFWNRISDYDTMARGIADMELVFYENYSKYVKLVSNLKKTID